MHDQGQSLVPIGEAAKRLGVSIDTLRNWEEKGILASFRPSAQSKRYYRTEDLRQFLEKGGQAQAVDMESMAEKWAFAANPSPLPSQFYCETSDVFQARLQRMELEMQRVEALKDIFSLAVAITGEIGNNSYNHNIGNWPDALGTFFGYDLKKRKVVLADRGQGVLKTLKRVVPELNDDAEALKVAFTQYISGRAPENRGNGLKFVRDSVGSGAFLLQFQSGSALLKLEGASEALNIVKTEKTFHGSFAVLSF